ncbi:SMI1/KNR4 family protein [Bacillus salitolerans]|uniref:SMI1/KNR4 family protein n=1 Tax=Bacillus salitolerans TaxID=1437434 RepID=A0ABW4LWT1_9BACI
MIPIARVAGDNQLCLDLRTTGSAPNLFWDYEIEYIEKGSLSFVADSLLDFLNSLFVSEE